MCSARAQGKLRSMNTTGYIINAALLLFVVRQIVGRKLDARTFLFPVAAIAVAAAEFLHSIPTAGNDLVLLGICVALGATFGGLCALATRIYHDRRGDLIARAGLLAASLWIAGVGARLAFAFAVEHGAGASVRQFSIEHHVTGSAAWVAALILMAFAEVLTRTGVLYLKSRRASAAYRLQSWQRIGSSTSTARA